MSASWRVAIICVVPQIARGYGALLRALGHEPVCVITPRRMRPGAPPVPLAAEHVAGDPDELDVLFAASNRSLVRLLSAYDLDLGLCTTFPWRLSAEAIRVPRLGIVNGHPSLLPRYRGPFPIAWAVRNGETEIGLSYHLMDASFDTGNLLAQRPVPIDDSDTFQSLLDKLVPVAGELLPIAFDRLARGDPGDPQDGGDYQSGFEDDYRYVDPTATAAEVHRQTRAWNFMPPIPNRGPILERNGTRSRLVDTSLTEADGAERLDCADGPLWVLETEPA
jgi:methionyl-tRNA formyltransferase